MKLFGDDPRQADNPSWNNGNYNNGQYGPQYIQGYGYGQSKDETSASGVVAMIVGAIFLGAVVYFAPAVLVLSILCILFNGVYRQSNDRLLFKDRYAGPGTHVFAIAVTLVTMYFVVRLMGYPHPWWSILLAVYGLISLLMDLLYKVIFERERSDGYESARLLGMPLSSNQAFFANAFHLGGHFALILFYVAVIFATVRS